MNYNYLNIVSLLLGLTALWLPVSQLIGRKPARSVQRQTTQLGSLAACVAAMLMQMIYQWHLVDIEDWSALMDTSGAAVMLSAGLAAVTIALNFISIIRNRESR